MIRVRKRGRTASHERWGPSTKIGAPLGSTFRLPHRSRDRVGVGGPARPHARHQLQRHVHRIHRPALGGRRLHRPHRRRSPRQSRLLRQARRTRAWAWASPSTSPKNIASASRICSRKSPQSAANAPLLNPSPVTCHLRHQSLAYCPSASYFDKFTSNS